MKVLLLLILLLPLGSAYAQLDQTQFSAVVKQDEAVFSLPLPAQKSFVWRRKETRPNAQEYRMDVTVKNAGGEFTFGYYLWKREGSNQDSGDFGSLLKAGQKSLFERTEPGRMTIVRDADVKVKVKDKNVVIELRGKDELKRIFSSKPAEAVFKIKLPDEPEIVQKIQIVYQ